MVKKNKLIELFDNEIIRYLIAGGLTTLVSFLTYILFTVVIGLEETPLQLQISNTVTWILSVLFAFYINKGFVFRHKSEHSDGIALIKFFSGRISTLVIDGGIMHLGTFVLGINHIIVKLIDMAVITVLNYIISKFFVFSGSKEEKGEDAT